MLAQVDLAIQHNAAGVEGIFENVVNVTDADGATWSALGATSRELPLLIGAPPKLRNGDVASEDLLPQALD